MVPAHITHPGMRLGALQGHTHPGPAPTAPLPVTSQLGAML